MTIPSKNSPRFAIYLTLMLTLMATFWTYYQDNKQPQVVSAVPEQKRNEKKSHILTQSHAKTNSNQTNIYLARAFYNVEIDVFAVHPKKQLVSEKTINSSPKKSTPQVFLTTPAESTTQVLQVNPEATAPPVPFKYLGKLFGDNEYIVFLNLHGKNIMIKTGEVIGQTYKIEEIKPPVMTTTYLPLNIKQTINIGQL